MQQNNHPNLFIIGAPKSGTTALANNLTQSAEIFLPENKEPRYFDAGTFYDQESDYPINNISEYLKLYENSENYKYRIDASVFNMYSEKSIDDILKFSPNAKIIIVLRDPVEASISMHKQRLKYFDTKMRETSSCFMTCWNSLDKRRNGEGYPKGCRNKFLFRYDLLFAYEKYLPYIINNVDKKNLKILSHSTFISNPDMFYRDICSFLEITPFKIINQHFNPSNIVDPSLFRMLLLKSIYFFRPLSKLLKIPKKIKLRILNLPFYAQKQKIEIDSSVEQSVYEFFLPTYSYLEGIKGFSDILHKQDSGVND